MATIKSMAEGSRIFLFGLTYLFNKYDGYYYWFLFLYNTIFNHVDDLILATPHTFQWSP